MQQQLQVFFKYPGLVVKKTGVG